MKDRLLNHWLRFQGSFWFVPGFLTVGAVALSFATIALDDAAGWDPSTDSPFGYAGEPEGARALMATIAASTITAAATAFSVTIAALALASSQFGPRLIRNFVADRGNQVVLGTFIGTFAYCLLVLRTVNSTPGDEFVPQVSITVGVGLALVSIAMLIYFIHHVATSIQATSIIFGVARELDSSIERLYKLPEEDGSGDDTTKEPEREQESVDLDEDKAGEIVALNSGYIQAIDIDALVEFARRRDIIIELQYHPGRFVLAHGALAFVWPKDAADEETEKSINAALSMGPTRTPTQDVEFAMDQLVEIAVRALSPGINDPFTAILCIDRLGAALVRIVEREFPEPLRRDQDGNLRLVAPFAGFGSVVDAAFNQIRQHGRGNAAILTRLLEALAVVTGRTENEEQREVLLRHAKMVQRAAESLPEENDRNDMNERYRDLVHALNRVRDEEQEEAHPSPSRSS